MGLVSGLFIFGGLAALWSNAQDAIKELEVLEELDRQADRKRRQHIKQLG